MVLNLIMWILFTFMCLTEIDGNKKLITWKVMLYYFIVSFAILN